MVASTIGLFLGTVLLGAMTPGPTTALVIRRSAVHGTAAVLPMLLGIELGLFAWAFAAAVGITALLAAGEFAYFALRIAGALFLIWLGVRAWLAARHIGDGDVLTAPAQTRATAMKAFGAGLFTNLANPKIAAFVFAFYPQFIADGANLLSTTLLLAALHILVDAGWFLTMALLVGRIRGFFQRAKVRRGLERTTGTAMIGLGIGMAADRI